MIFRVQATIPEKLFKLDRIARDEVDAYVLDAVKQIAAQAARNLSGGVLARRSGKGLASLESKVTKTASKVEGRVGSKLFYLRMLETGIKPHAISLHRRRQVRRGGQRGFRHVVSRFKGMPVGGGVFRTRAQHPGVRPRRWLSQIGEEFLRTSSQDFAKRLERAIDRQGNTKVQVR